MRLPRALPPVVPIVIFHGREPWTVPLSVSEAVEMPAGPRAPRAEAVETWMKQGEAKGKAETLPRLLERRFGAVPEAARARVPAASVADLDGRIDAIPDAGNVDEVFVNGPAHQA